MAALFRDAATDSFPALVSVKPSRRVVRRDKTQIRTMKKISLFALALASLVINSSAAKTNFAAQVISYHPGTGAAAGFTNTSAVLGEPSRVNPFGDAVEPFNPPYRPVQLLSIGAGGFVTIKFDKPVEDKSKNPFGLDFILFGNTGFIVTNDFDPITYESIGTPATDGSTFGNSTGATRVSVSKDGEKWYVLDPALAPVADGLFPTDGAGDFRVPTQPGLTAAHFAGATVEDIREFYASSGGGTGYDIAWARKANGKKADLSSIRYVRVEVLSGRAELDGFVEVDAPKRQGR